MNVIELVKNREKNVEIILQGITERRHPTRNNKNGEKAQAHLYTFDILCRRGLISSETDLPNAICITLFDPRKNLRHKVDINLSLDS